MKKLLPLLVLYVVLISVFWRPTLEADEGRYVRYAENLASGHYAEPGLKLWNGPGYPLVLAPFVQLGAPVASARLLNAIFLCLSAGLVYGLLCRYVTKRVALTTALLMGLYAPFYPELVALLTEPLAVLLVSAMSFCIVKSVRDDSRVFSILAGMCFGYLALTKVLFGYVLVAGLVISTVFAFKKVVARKTLLTCAVGLLCCAPYLAYTYSLTGRPMYWSNAGGLSLYWMSSPYAGEYGDWTSPADVLENEGFEQHRPLFERIESMDCVEKDQVLRRAAIDNIKAHPGKFLSNWAMNVSRIWFCYPNSNKLQRPHTLGYIVFNAFLLVACLGCVIPLWRARKRLPSELVVLITFAAIFLAGTSLLSAVPRMMNPVVPVFFIVMGFTAGRLVEVRLRDGVSALMGKE